MCVLRTWNTIVLRSCNEIETIKTKLMESTQCKLTGFYIITQSLKFFVTTSIISSCPRSWFVDLGQLCWDWSRGAWELLMNTGIVVVTDTILGCWLLLSVINNKNNHSIQQWRYFTCKLCNIQSFTCIRIRLEVKLKQKN